MVNIFFIRQREVIKGGMVHVEKYVEDALNENSEINLTTFDLGAEILEVRKSGELYFTERLLKKADSAVPDIVLFLNGFVIDEIIPGSLQLLKDAGHTLIAWHADDPYYFDIQANFVHLFDYVFTVDSSTIPYYERLTNNVAYLPFACSRQALNDVKKHSALETYKYDICFIGIPFKGSARLSLIDQQAEFLSQFDTRIIGGLANDNWSNNMRNYHFLEGKVFNDWVDPKTANYIYSKARINLNLHKDSWGHLWDRNSKHIVATSPNERFFMIAGIGGFQVVDDSRPDLLNLFPNELLATFSYDSSTTFRHQIRYFLDHDEERCEMAQTLQSLVMDKHCYSNRIDTIISVLFH